MEYICISDYRLLLEYKFIDEVLNLVLRLLHHNLLAKVMLYGP